MSRLSWIRPENAMDAHHGESLGMMGARNLGHDFNPHKFDFAPVPMRKFSPQKCDLGLVGPQESQRDLLELLPECLGPETQLFLPQMGITSHQDVSLVEHDNMTGRGYFPQQSPATPALDTDTLKLLDSLELKFAPSSVMMPSTAQTTTVDISQVVVDVLNQPPVRPHHPELDSALEDKSKMMDVENTEGLSREAIRVMRNKAVQKRYRIRKKNESQRQIDAFAQTKRKLMVVESNTPQYRIAVVDELLRLRKMNIDRDDEIQRLRKMLATEEASKEVSDNELVVMGRGPAEHGDFCDDKIEVYVPRKVALDTFAEACCEKMVGDASPMVAKALASSSYTMSSLLER